MDQKPESAFHFGQTEYIHLHHYVRQKKLFIDYCRLFSLSTEPSAQPPSNLLASPQPQPQQQQSAESPNLQPSQVSALYWIFHFQCNLLKCTPRQSITNVLDMNNLLFIFSNLFFSTDWFFSPFIYRKEHWSDPEPVLIGHAVSYYFLLQGGMKDGTLTVTAQLVQTGQGPRIILQVDYHHFLLGLRILFNWSLFGPSSLITYYTISNMRNLHFFLLHILRVMIISWLVEFRRN